jgi:hypothetical protein
MKTIFSVALCLTLLGSIAIAGDTKSGLAPGDRAGAFSVEDVTGPKAGKTLCYRCSYGAKPVVTIFTRELNDSVAALIKAVDTTVGANSGKDMRAFVVLLTDDPKAGKTKLAAFAKKHSITQKVPLTTFKDNKGPGSYKIAKGAELTVLMWKNQRVEVNHAFKKANVDAATVKKVVAEASKIL